MYALFSETLDGAVTIRAFDQQVRLRCSYPLACMSFFCMCVVVFAFHYVLLLFFISHFEGLLLKYVFFSISNNLCLLKYVSLFSSSVYSQCVKFVVLFVVMSCFVL